VVRINFGDGLHWLSSAAISFARGLNDTPKITAATRCPSDTGFTPGLAVSTTHITTGGIFGIGLLRRREADWRRVRNIVIGWFVTLPMAALLAVVTYWLLAR
jgi:phosphate/sulfate permease